MERLKARLTIEQHQLAINEAIHIDASPHEWPTAEKIPLLCNALVDSVVMVDYLALRLAAVEQERDAARAEAARAVEALKAIRSHLGTKAKQHENEVSNDFSAGESHGWRMAYWQVLEMSKKVNTQPALDWLAQQRREAAAEALEQLANDLRQDPFSCHLHTVDSFRQILRDRAALRATKEDK